MDGACKRNIVNRIFIVKRLKDHLVLIAIFYEIEIIFHSISFFKGNEMRLEEIKLVYPDGV